MVWRMAFAAQQKSCPDTRGGPELLWNSMKCRTYENFCANFVLRLITKVGSSRNFRISGDPTAIVIQRLSVTGRPLNGHGSLMSIKMDEVGWRGLI